MPESKQTPGAIIPPAVDPSTFMKLLLDVCRLIQLAESEEGHAWLAHSAVVVTTLLPELASNCCLAYLDYPEKAFEELERLPPLPKFELFAERFNKELDCGDHRVGSVRGVIKVRNEIVHAKRRRVPIEEQAGGKPVEVFGTYKTLPIPKVPAPWTPDHARIVLRAVTEFLNYLMIDLCRLSAQTCLAVLDQVHIKEGGDAGEWREPPSPAFYLERNPYLQHATKEWGLDFSFVGASRDVVLTRIKNDSRP
jgi:hypothetical protein